MGWNMSVVCPLIPVAVTVKGEKRIKLAKAFPLMATEDKQSQWINFTQFTQINFTTTRMTYLNSYSEKREAQILIYNLVLLSDDSFHVESGRSGLVLSEALMEQAQWRRTTLPFWQAAKRDLWMADCFVFAPPSRYRENIQKNISKNGGLAFMGWY